MKKTLLKDSVRGIKATASKFIAIVAIICLSITFFTGLRISGTDMQHTGDVYLDTYNLMDFRLISTVGFDEEDIRKVRETDGVEGVLPAYTIDAIVSTGKKSVTVSVHSLPSVEKRSGKNYINIPMVLEGRLPENSGEGVIEELLYPEIKIGQKITVNSGRKNKELDSLKSKTIKVVGVVRSPFYISKVRGNSTIGNGKIKSFVYINEEEFTMPVYNDIYITMKGAKNLDTFGDEYKKQAAVMEKRLKVLGSERVAIRYDDIVDYASKELSRGEGNYNQSVSSSLLQLQSAEEEYEKGKVELSATKNKLANNQMEVQRQELISNNEISSGLTTIENNENHVNGQIEALKSAIEKAKEGGYYQQQGPALEGQYTELLMVKTELEKSKTELLQRRVLLQGNIDLAKEQLREAEEKLLKANEDIIFSERKLQNGKKMVGDSLFVANRQLSNSLEEIKDIKKINWYILDRRKNIGFADYENAALRMKAISKAFPLIFVFVAILICITTIGRMVDEQRSYIGTLKALGYSTRDILQKYLIYATSASLIGSVIGVLVGFNIFAKMIFKAYRNLYIMPELICLFDVPLACVSIFTSIFLTCVTAVLVCSKTLKSNSATLLRPKSPKAGNKTILERIDFIWSKLKFTHKVTARNLFRYKARAFMTIIGVAGCSALLVVGFGLKDAVGYTGYAQFDKLFKYTVAINLTGNDSEREKSVKDVKKVSSIIETTEVMMLNAKAEKDKSIDISFIVPKDARMLSSYIVLQDRITQKNLKLSDDGVIISEKLAKLLKIKRGDHLNIQIDDFKSYDVMVSGITENYVNHYAYASPNLFKSVFKDEELKWDTLLATFVNPESGEVDKVTERLLSIDGIGIIQKKYINKDAVEDSSVDVIVGILIGCAALLSFIVLYTLTNININERIREIATIKVLGFYNRETASYVLRENLILSFIGALFGLVLGRYLCSFVILTTEVEILMFGRDIKPFSFVFSLIITIGFSGVVNLIMLRSIKNINMVEALKTVE